MNKEKVLNNVRLFIIISYYLTFFIPVYPGLSISQMNSGGVYSGIFLVLIFIMLYSMYFEKVMIGVSSMMMLIGMLTFELFLYYGKLDTDYMSIAFYLQIILFFALVIVTSSKDVVFSIVEVLVEKFLLFKEKHCKRKACVVEEIEKEEEQENK